MLPGERLSRITEYRQRKMTGLLVELNPMRPEHTDAVLALRNSERALFNLAQYEPLKPEQHNAWYRGYLARNDDVAWMITTLDGRIIGTIALYAIDPAGRTAEKGRQVVDEQVALRAPYALESELMTLKFAFDILEIERVFVTIRPENVKVISMHLRQGFVPSGQRELRSTLYNEYALHRDDFKPQKLESILQHWRQRDERASA